MKSNNKNLTTPTHGYCTATANASSKQSVWLVYSSGNMSYTNVISSGRMGVRPVIEVYKSSLK